MLEEIYLVKGGTGEWDDAHEWNVCATETLTEAMAVAGDLNQWCVLNKAHRSNVDDDVWIGWDEDTNKHPPHDPDFLFGENGVEYSVRLLKVVKVDALRAAGEDEEGSGDD